MLHYIADLPVAEVAAQLSVPRGTVLSWLHRGRGELAVQLKERGAPVPGANEVRHVETAQ